MVIVVNTRLLLKERLEGIGWFTFETLKRITRDHPEHQFVFLFDRPFDSSFVFSDNVIPLVLRPPARHPVLWYLWFEWRIPQVLDIYHADAFLSPDGYLSLRAKVPQLAVIHDINFYHRPGDLPWLSSWYCNRFFPEFARKASRVATVSEYSRKDIATSFGIDENRIDVVFNGCNTGFRPLEENEAHDIRARYTKGEPFFLFVGALHPRKNVEGLLMAFDIYKKTTGYREKLVIAGGHMFKTGKISKTLRHMKHRDEVVFTGRLHTSELKKVFGAALALVFVPFFEGFGIPVLEAFASSVPVICSHATALPEVGGDAVIYVNPGDTEGIAEAMHRIRLDPELRKDMISKGLRQLGKFSWDKSAARLWDSIEKMMADNGITLP